ncbi:fused 4'-phosphopantothenoylcysteine decarboxylase; phosphopantothenoylcysteine synthetase, FMN-binding [Thiomonas sp. X19]|uniref:bifunctional phosphopantothenoylcysteine decarboxylase/phosphopantothenate--cysteine ligase CoaBC n=1 Tax=Thiomonas sp. X19 TaxID=1050370 RepID=UPI000B72177E|nr:bifunctional phosphopantothenoylcysteine decarboxylase/phosphopantothenate--cysteine ligase CoaBC [Thiomonas sp. X19]SCC95287.1 fused 4'-phosphopantothenoylcysteine decarboxylase; phosphopantothenoylcysteine synthetase, FMN-binding [Thiomonas sp. X19]
MINPIPQSRHILLGVSGGVAAYKACELVRGLTKAGHQVQVVMTTAATHFVGPATFQALSGRLVATDQWQPLAASGMDHIDLVRAADALVVAPASADCLGKAANGLGDDLLSTLVLARGAVPTVFAPAMNREMWANAAVQRNVQRLREDGVRIAGPASGEQACGEVGEGRMIEPEHIVLELEALFQPKALAGRRVLITAGPTFEPWDAVRGLTNRSSGKMGWALARAAWEQGAEVTLVAGPTALPPPYGVRLLPVETALQMRAAVLAALPGVDVFIAAAAVADWRPSQAHAGKLKKQPDQPPPVLQLDTNPDILAEIAARPDAPYCVGFAAEADDLLANAQAKRQRKGVPLLVGNLGPQTFGRDDNACVLIDAHGTTELPRASKLELGRRIVSETALRLPSCSKPHP